MLQYDTLLLIEELLEVAEASLKACGKALSEEAIDLDLAAAMVYGYRTSAPTVAPSKEALHTLALTAASCLALYGAEQAKDSVANVLHAVREVPAPAAPRYRERKKVRMWNMKRRGTELRRKLFSEDAAFYEAELRRLTALRTEDSALQILITLAAQRVTKCLRFTPDHKHYELSNQERFKAALLAITDYESQK